MIFVALAKGLWLREPKLLPLFCLIKALKTLTIKRGFKAFMHFIIAIRMSNLVLKWAVLVAQWKSAHIVTERL